MSPCASELQRRAPVQVLTAYDVDAIMPTLRDPDRRITLLKEVEKWSSAHADTIVEIAAQVQIERVRAQMADAVHQMARTQFQRTSPCRSRMQLFEDGKRQSCREALAVTNSSDSLLALAWTTWVAVHKLKLATKHVKRKQHHNGPNNAVNYKKHGRDGTTH